jgi:Cu/Ag efflux protein CusF
VWVVADVAEQDIGLVRNGSKASIKINAYPDKTLEGKVTYVYPTLKMETRSVPVRVELANPGLLLKPAMFAQVELPVSAKGQVLTVPVSAVIDSGTRQIVLVQLAAGRFEPRPVLLGERSNDFVAVREGLKEGEQVVTAANFLIDAESNLKAALSGFGSASNAIPALADSAQAATKVIASVSHRADGKIESVDEKTLTLSISHGPVASLKWPAMTMEFKLANAALIKDLKPGAKVTFEFVERQSGEWVITSVTK